MQFMKFKFWDNKLIIKNKKKQKNHRNLLRILKWPKK